MSLERDLLQGERAIERLSAGTQREVLRAYARTLRELRGTLADYAARYAVGGKMSYVELAKYRRLESLTASVRAEMNRLYAQAGKAVTVGSGNAYSEAYWRTAYALERQAQARLGWTLLNPATIAASVQNPISGMKLSERLQANRAQVVTRIRSEITQGLIRGEGYDDMARRIKGVLDGDAAKAIRVAQTEAHRVTQEGRLAALEQAERRGVPTMKTWSATLDERTRLSHQELDGQTVPVDGFFEIRGLKAKAPGGFGVPEEDCNCRCALRGKIAGYEPTVRRARGEGVIPWMTYAEWKANRVSG